MYTRTYASTIGFFLLSLGILGIIEITFSLSLSDTWPVALISIGVYMILLPKRKSEIPFLPQFNFFKNSQSRSTILLVGSDKNESLRYRTMKAAFVSLYGVFAVTAIITHIWTVIIAFSEGGFFAGILSLFLPFLAELYWMFKMFGENDTYAYIALTHLLLAIPFSVFGRE